MNWLTLRQYRTQAIAGYAAMFLLAAVFVLTGFQIWSTFVDSGLRACLAGGGQGCEQLSTLFSDRYSALQWFLPLVLVAPALFGMFWGAPLVARELEHGTHRLAWTQGVTRRRWITSKLVIVMASAAVASGILAAAVTWWSRGFVDSHNWVRLDFGPFDLTGIVPVAYTLFAVALGVALGAIFRKTLPAVFATLPIFFAVRIPLITLARKHYMTPMTTTTPLAMEEPHITGSATGGLRDWVFRSEVVDKTGAPFGQFGITPQMLADRCPDLLGPGELPEKIDAARCMSRLGVRVSETFHPDSRYWSFQWIEAGIFLVLAAALVAFVIWRVKRVN